MDCHVSSLKFGLAFCVCIYLYFAANCILHYCRCGPLRNMWCMRYEAKHRFFKQIAKVIGNFKNIAKTVSLRHQRYMCYVLSNPTQFLQDQQHCGPVTSLHISRLECREKLMATCSTISSDSTVQRYIMPR